MAGRIPQQFIDDLIARTDIVGVIDAHVPLKKAGKEYKACCPFHNEKTPSFTVNPEKQFYHCFGCGVHGTAIGFLMEYERLEFVDAVEELARRLGLEVPRADGSTKQGSDDTRSLYGLLVEAERYFQDQLRNHVQAINYLKGRGLSGEIVRHFGIGYVPSGWNNIIRALDAHPVMQLIKAGLVIESEGRRYDRFRDRVMFPIRDRRGQVIGFGGRLLGEGTPKYLNSPETPIFHKGRQLYGLYEARKAARELLRIVVVEGYMDVVSLAQFGIRNAVATLGTAVTSTHMQTLFRATSEVIFCFDGDRAGRDAAWRSLECVLPEMREGRQVRFVFLPEGEDPDTLVRRIGPEAFQERVGQAEPLSGFLVDTLRQRVDLGSLEGRAQLAEMARPYLARMPAGIYQRLMIERLAVQTRIDTLEFSRLLDLPEVGVARTALRPNPRRNRSGRSSPSLVRYAITLLLQQPALAQQGGDPHRFEGLMMPGVALLVEMLELLQQHPHMNAAGILEHWRDHEDGSHLETLSRRSLLFGEERIELEVEFIETLANLEKQLMEQRCDLRLQELKQKSFSDLTEDEKLEFKQLVGQSYNPQNHPRN